jgi:hypothetical protein
MFVIRNETNGQQTTCRDWAHVKRILRLVVKRSGLSKRQALAGIYVDAPGERDPFYAVDLSL